MKDIQQLLLKIDYFLVLSEEDPDSFIKTARDQLSHEHALEQAESRATNSKGEPDRRLGQFALDETIKVMYAIQKSKEIFDKIEPDSKWIIETTGNLKAVIQKIYEHNQWKFILKTFLGPNMVETGVSGVLKEFVDQILTESKNAKIITNINERKKIIKALEKLLERKLPMLLETLKKNSSPEFWIKLTGLIPSIKGGIVTPEIVAQYKLKLEIENANAMKLWVR